MCCVAIKSISEKRYFKQSNSTCFSSSDINFLVKQSKKKPIKQKIPNKKTAAAQNIPVQKVHTTLCLVHLQNIL